MRTPFVQSLLRAQTVQSTRTCSKQYWGVNYYKMKSKIYLRICCILIILNYFFGIGTSMNSFCIDGCMVHRLAGIVLPLYDSSHKISVWQNVTGIALRFPVQVGDGLYTVDANRWTNINTFYRDGVACASFEHYQTKVCSTEKDELIFSTDSGSLWKLDCNGSSCGCRQHLLIALSYGPKDLPVTFFLRPKRAANGLFFTWDSNDAVIQLQAHLKWHDITISYEFNDIEGGRYVVHSDSLGQWFVTDNSSSLLWLFAGNEDIAMPSLFGLGCSEPPKHSPPDTVGIRPENFGGEMHKPTTLTPLLILLAIPIIAIVTICLKRERGCPPTAVSTEDVRNEERDETGV